MDAVERVLSELCAARIKHGGMRGAHEGYAVLLEEVDELWDAVKADDLRDAGREAAHVAAMALRFLIDVCGYTFDDATEGGAADA